MRKIPNEELGRPTPERYAEMEKLPVTVVLDNVRSMQNVGSFFRTCDAFGIGHLALCGITATPPARDIHKTALGAELTLPWSYHPSTVEYLDELRAEGVRLVAIEQVEGSVTLADFEPQPSERYALVFGNEVEGVSQEAVDRCDLAVEIPQIGIKHSLNVSVSGGVVLWEMFRKIK